jgi:two-component system phosphate regulon response regulator OmpR
MGRIPSPPDVPHVLIVDDEEGICKLLSRYLSRNGFRTSVARSGSAMMAQLERATYDLILLDLNLGTEDGLDFLRILNSRHSHPIIVISGRKNPVERVVGLEMGASDYICKPFHLREVLARSKKALRFSNTAHTTAKFGEEDKVLCFDGWKVSLSRRQLVAPDGSEVPLTTGEFKLLTVFLTHVGRVLSRQQLMDLTHGFGWQAYERTVDAQISRLRRKIEVDPRRPCLIKAVHGDGYIFTTDVSKTIIPAPNLCAIGSGRKRINRITN